METPTQFDLNGAIQRWRQRLEKSASISGADLEELELHVRDSWRTLMARGLEAREAFLIAVRRLGADKELEAEFAKVNIRQAWSDRAVWGLCGLLAANLLWAVVSLFSNAVLNLALWQGMDAHVTGGLFLLTKWLTAGALVTLGFLVLPRMSQSLARAVHLCLQKPVWTGIALVLALEGFQLLPRHAMRWLEPLWQAVTNPGRPVPPESQAVIQRWFFWEWITTQICWIASVPLFAGYLAKRSAPSRLPNPAGAAEELEPMEREAVRTLQGQGLSVQEALLLIKYRRNAAEELPGANNTSAPSPWLERGFWMLVGAVIERLAVPFVLEPSTILMSATRTSAVFIQHLAGFGAMCLCLGAIAGIFVGVSIGVKRYQREVKWAGRLCCRRPVLAAVLSVVLVFGAGASLYSVERMMLPGQHGIGPIGSGWLQYCALTSHLIVPVTLLVWLARNRRTKTREAVQPKVQPAGIN